MDNIGFAVTGDRDVGLRFEQFPGALRKDLLADITTLTDELEERVEEAAPRKSGKLAGEIVQQIYDDAESVAGRVTLSGDFAKAGALEYGAHGTARVREHAMRLDHNWDRKLNAPELVMVQAYSRDLDIVEREFLHGPLASMEYQILSTLEQSVNKTIEAGQ